MTSLMEKMVANMGFISTNEFMLKFALPIFAIVTIFSLVVKFLFTALPSYFPFLLFIIGMGFIFIYPWANFQKKKK